MSDRWQARLSRVLLHHTFGALSRAGRLVHRPAADIEVLRDIRYMPHSTHRAHRLDILRPRQRLGPAPLIVYIHGGGFTVCAKETHWMLVEPFAAAGFCVANVEYRLAPGSPYPAAVQDVQAALAFVRAHADAYEIDATKPVLAGESAGANLALGLAMASPGPVGAVLASCGLLQLTDTARALASPLIRARLAVIRQAYAPGPFAAEDLASPLCAVQDLSRPMDLPPILVQVGERDPIREDSLRLHEALSRRGLKSTLHAYPGQPHAFQAFFWTRAAHAFWGDTLAFLDAHGLLPPQTLAGRTPTSSRTQKSPSV